jgi:hypothetical protein
MSIDQPETLSIKRLQTPLILPQYVLDDTEDHRRVLVKNYRYWKVYERLREKFIYYQGILQRTLERGERPTGKLWDKYVAVREDLLTAQEIIDKEFEEEAE